MSEADEMLESLRQALALSPDNAVLRRQVASMLMSRGRWSDAEDVLREGVRQPHADAGLQLLLARCFESQGKASEALVLAEALAEPAAGKTLDPKQLIELARVLVKGGNTERASSVYRRAIDADPNVADEQLGEAVGVGKFRESDDPPFDDDDIPFGDDEDDDVDEFGRVRQRVDGGFGSPVEMEKPGVNFEDVGGMDALKEEIRIKIIAPLENAELFKAYGKAVGGGILMYGPPGCGKTHLARATAGQINAGFINVGIHDVLDMYIGQSEQKLHALFQYARQHSPCVLFFDEVDALGAKRTDMRGSAGRQVINQFLAELDGVKDSNDGLLILAATNAPWHLDSAFRRPGRFDRVLFVPPPDEVSAAEILRVQLKDKPQQAVDHAAVAKKCKRFSGADLKAVVDQAVEAKLREAMKTGTPSPLTTKDLAKAVKGVKPSTLEWFATAKNHALYANEAGVYDDVIEYLKMK